MKDYNFKGWSMSHASSLKGVYLFKNFTDAELSKIAQVVEEKNYSPGQEIFLNGQDAHSLYVIKFGTVKAFSTRESGDELNIANFGIGSLFGEIPFVDGGKRSATVQAVEPATILEIQYEKLRSVLNADTNLSSKFYKELAGFIATRLRVTTENYQQARELKLKHF